MEEGAPRVPPAPKSRLQVNEALDPCNDILTEQIFNAIVEPASEEGKALYTYKGLCDAIALYNSYHDEKFAKMGDEEQIRAELAAFLAHTAVDTYGYSVTREISHCVDPITGSDGQVYCKPCKEQYYNPETKTCSQSYFESEESYGEKCDLTRQVPQGCRCDKESVKQVDVPVPVNAGNIDTVGYIPASDAYFARGTIPISWNYGYYGASLALAGNSDLLCDNPDLVATNPQYAWGSGIHIWMEKMFYGTTGSTAHRQVLNGGNFGGTVQVLYGTLECPSNQWESAIHVDMVHDRVAEICKSGTLLGVYLEMDKCDTKTDCLKCEGLKEIYDSCHENGSCPYCPTWTQFVKSDAPTVTPLRIESPTFENWNHHSRSAADTGEHAVAYNDFVSFLAFTISWNFVLSPQEAIVRLCILSQQASRKIENLYAIGKMFYGTTGSTAHRQVLNGGNFGGTVQVLYGTLECPPNQWVSASRVDMVQDRIAEVCKTGTLLEVYLEMGNCSSKADCLTCDGLKEIYDTCQENGSCPYCPTWTQFVRSSAPTVTPILVEAPSFEDWNENFQIPVTTSTPGMPQNDPTASPVSFAPTRQDLYTPKECSSWISTLKSADKDFSDSVSESEYYSFLSSIQDPLYISEYFKSYAGFDELPWPFRVVHKSLSCHCEKLGFGDECCEGDSSEIVLIGLDTASTNNEMDEEYTDLFCQQIAYVLARSVPKPPPTFSASTPAPSLLPTSYSVAFPPFVPNDQPVPSPPTLSPAPSTNRHYCGASQQLAQKRCDVAILCPDKDDIVCLRGQACYEITGPCGTISEATSPVYNSGSTTFSPTSPAPTKGAPPPTGSPTGSPTQTHVFDRNAINFCGVDYNDVIKNCYKNVVCPTGNTTECPSGQMCFPGIENCDTPPPTTSLTPTDYVTTEEPTTAPTLTPPTREPTGAPKEDYIGIDNGADSFFGWPGLIMKFLVVWTVIWWAPMI
eukprot:CAMPEP_0183747744 /NCGR_PEP_ID=MMETSP0737-20130205/67411_1 /TAXON_ID=385413 /ORGANISM="Thalassiosira miniscula, Strain CCMP1093" /LENGTH=967 /DNA_ID=CAMNT_0025983461 /DNA_START=817 /DNA_END=3721 /DNA_ORIENTATION=-